MLQQILAKMPKDVWLIILSFLPAEELLKCARISKLFNELANDEKLWKLKVEQELNAISDDKFYEHLIQSEEKNKLQPAIQNKEISIPDVLQALPFMHNIKPITETSKPTSVLDCFVSALQPNRLYMQIQRNAAQAYTIRDQNANLLFWKPKITAQLKANFPQANDKTICSKILSNKRELEEEQNNCKRPAKKSRFN